MTCVPFRMGKLSKVPGMLWTEPPAPPVREIATFRGKSETANFSFSGISDGSGNFFSPNYCVLFGNCPTLDSRKRNLRKRFIGKETCENRSRVNGTA